MNNKVADTLGLGLGFWLLGYITSIVLFPFVSQNVLGWILTAVFTPICLLITYFRFRHRKESMHYYFLVAMVWVAIAIIFDYLFIVQLFHPADYYKVDVFAYYLLTFLMPIVVGRIVK